MPVIQDDAMEDPRCVIAALRQELDSALAREATLTGMLTQRDSEYGEQIEQQTATAEVLRGD